MEELSQKVPSPGANQAGKSRLMAVIPLRADLFFPEQEMTVEIGRQISKLAIRSAQKSDQRVLLLTQKQAEIEDPSMEDFYDVGIVAEIQNTMNHMGQSSMRVVMKALYRVRLLSIEQHRPFMMATYDALEAISSKDEAKHLKALDRKLQTELFLFSRNTGRLNQEQLTHFEQLNAYDQRVNYVAALLLMDLTERYSIISETNLTLQLEQLIRFLIEENELVMLENEINAKLKTAIDRAQKEYYLREKMKVISEELGDNLDKEQDIQDLRARIDAAAMPDKIRKIAHKEVDKIVRTSIASPEYGNQLNYIEFMLSLPWQQVKEANDDIVVAERILDEDHYGLARVKERIIEFLAVQILNGNTKGSIICLVGPPGVGKTSLAKSVARATGRDFVRLSLGGIQDEAEIRGHRRTYVGAIPGRLLQNLARAGSSNPVFLLDEIDKICRDFRGDPASALLEALDPAQNDTFSDHYLEVPYDLSQVFFLTTANTLTTIPEPLRDRMEIIEVPSYTELEKLEIAKRYLVPRQIKEHGLEDKMISFSEAALRCIINDYTREAGVRELERKIATICRKSAKRILEDPDTKKQSITVRNVSDLLGKRLVHHLITSKDKEVGVAVGLAWTPYGGEILKIECQTMPGEGKLKLTGTLGDVMKESAEMSFSYIRSRADRLDLNPEMLEKRDMHIHIPDGATPKDGPSAGVSLTTAIMSALADRSIHQDVAMTGEMTLRGKVLPVGGIREKVMGALRAGCQTVIIPEDNARDVDELPDSVKDEVTIVYAARIEDVWSAAFV